MGFENGKIIVVPGMPMEQGSQSQSTFPSSTTNFVKLLREQGLDVEVTVPKEDREYLDLNAAEVWLPVLIFTAQPIWDMAVIAVVGAIKSYFAGRKVDGAEEVDLPAGVLHLRCTFEEPDGSRREFDGHGPPAGIVESLKAFGHIE